MYGTDKATPEKASYFELLLTRIQSRSVTITVIGLGNVGLPLVVAIGKAGFNVVGLDINESLIDQLSAGESHVDDVNSSDLKALIDQGKLLTTTNFIHLQQSDIVIICVPTPLNKTLAPDLRYIRSAIKGIAKHVRPGQLISLESTTYPGTTDEMLKPMLEAAGMKVGEDVFLAHSPERVDPGNKEFDTKSTNKVVGGTDEKSLAVAKAFYELIVDHVVPVSSARMAEMVKLFENSFRAINIGFVNEMAILCDSMDLSIWEMLDAAFTKPFGIMPFYPGPGIGGHCIPIDPYYLEWKSKEYGFSAHIIALASEINSKMPAFVVDKKLAGLLNTFKKPINGSRILMLGMAYKTHNQ